MPDVRTTKLPSGDARPGAWSGHLENGRGQAPPRRRGRGAEARHRSRHDADRHGRNVCQRRRRDTWLPRPSPDSRDEVFIVSKVLPSNASRRGVETACEKQPQAAARRNHRPLSAALARFGAACRDGRCLRGAEGGNGKIRQWGVSNFDTDDMEELAGLAAGKAVQTNQVLYNPTRAASSTIWSLGARTAAFRSWPIRRSGRAAAQGCAARSACPAAQRHGRADRPGLGDAPAPDIAIPKASRPEHVRDNRAALDIALTTADLAELDRLFRRRGASSRSK